MSDAVWHCLDCRDPECSNQEHAWVRACLVELPDGSEAWLLEEPTEDDNG